jgi:hypothetical protein
MQAAAALANISATKQQGIPETGRIALAGYADASEPLLSLKTSASASTLKCRPKTARGIQQLKPVHTTSTNGCTTVVNGNNGLKKKCRPTSAPPKRSNGMSFNTYGGSSSNQMLLLQQHTCVNDADSTDNTIATPTANGDTKDDMQQQQQPQLQYCCASGELDDAIQQEIAYVDMQADPSQLQQSEVVKLVTRLRQQLVNTNSSSLQTDHPTVGYIQALEVERQQARTAARQQAVRYNELKLAYTALQRHQVRPSTGGTTYGTMTGTGKVRCKSSICCAKLLSHSQSLGTLRSPLRA